MRKQGGNAPAITCPQCGARYVLEEKAQRKKPRLWRQIADARVLEASVPSQPWREYRQSVAPPAPQVASSAPLAPGEATYRTLDTNADVITPMRYSLIWAGVVIVFGGTAALAITTGSPWWWLGAAGDSTFGLFFYLTTRPMLRIGGLDINGWLRTRERLADDAPQEAQRQCLPYHVEGKLERKPGQQLYLDFDLTDHQAALAWHRFCRDVATRGKNFSQTEAVKRHHLPPQDWDRVYQTFTRRGWCTFAAKRETPRLRAEGWGWVCQFARTPPPKQLS